MPPPLPSSVVILYITCLLSITPYAGPQVAAGRDQTGVRGRRELEQADQGARLGAASVSGRDQNDAERQEPEEAQRAGQRPHGGVDAPGRLLREPQGEYHFGVDDVVESYTEVFKLTQRQEMLRGLLERAAAVLKFDRQWTRA